MKMKYKDKNEIINKKENPCVTLLYRTFIGRIILNIIVKPWFTKLSGYFMNSRLSNIISFILIRKYKINKEEYVNSKFNSYNDFFTRKKQSKYLNIDKNPNNLIAPADSKLTVYNIKSNNEFKIKDSYYNIYDLLDGNRISEEYDNGKILIFRLETSDYHRYCYIDDGSKGVNIYIKGVFHTVRNIALKKYNIYKKNAREYTIMNTKNFGKVIEVDVGAMIVGRINNHHGDYKFKKGEEKGYFEFNGSTIVLLFKKGYIDIDEDILINSKNGIETIVKYGEKIGTRKRKSRL